MAYLQQIWWFEVDGMVNFPFPAGNYTLSFRLHLGRFSNKRLGRRVCNFEHTHGWDIKPVRFELSTSDGQQASGEFCLDITELDDGKTANTKRGCWIDYKVGEFLVLDSDSATEIRFSMKQIDCTHSKGGLCVDSVFIIPSDLRERRRRRGFWVDMGIGWRDVVYVVCQYQKSQRTLLESYHATYTCDRIWVVEDITYYYSFFSSFNFLEVVLLYGSVNSLFCIRSSFVVVYTLQGKD